MDQNKTAVNKGVWEFRELRHTQEPAASVQAEAAWTSRELDGVLTPPIVKTIP